MKLLLLICMSSLVIAAGAQTPLAYEDLLLSAPELEIRDSLVLDSGMMKGNPVDSFSMKKWFSPILSSGNNKFKNKVYSLNGKITSHEYFDILALQEDKLKNDTLLISVLYLITARKTGEYIASLKAAVNGTKKKAGYNTSSCLYKNDQLVQDSHIITTEQTINDITRYKINSGGRFIIYSNN